MTSKIFEALSDNDESVDPKTYDFARQTKNYTDLKAVLNKVGITLPNMTAGTRNGAVTFKLWSNEIDSRTKKPLFTWHKYESGTPGSGQNYVSFGGTKYFLADFLSREDLQVRLKDIIDRDKTPISDLEKSFAKYFKVAGTYEVVDGIVNVTGTVTGKPAIKKLGKLPFKFGTVTEQFIAKKIGLTTLEGFPEKARRVDAQDNLLTDCIHSPKDVGAIDLCGNVLTSLIGLPDDPMTTLYLSWNENLPLLQLLKLSSSHFGIYDEKMFNHPTGRIIGKYKKMIEEGGSLRKAMIQCQKELIDNGFKGNARL